MASRPMIGRHGEVVRKLIYLPAGVGEGEEDQEEKKRKEHPVLPIKIM